MSTAALAFNWKAPVPQVFTRASGPTFWPGDRRCRPLDPALRRIRDLAFLTEALPPDLKAILRERFKPARGALKWETPPALPTSVREGYDLARLGNSSEEYICLEIQVTAGLIERLLNAPEGLVGGLTQNYLLAVQVARLAGRASGRFPAGAGIAPAAEGAARATSPPLPPRRRRYKSPLPAIRRQGRRRYRQRRPRVAPASVLANGAGSGACRSGCALKQQS